MLWHYNFYDHPLDCVALYKGTPIWFSVIDDGAWKSINNLPTLSKLSKYELESINYGKEMENEYWCRDSIYGIYKLTDNKFRELNEYQNELLDYGFKNVIISHLIHLMNGLP